jgi:hypothetical protein
VNLVKQISLMMFSFLFGFMAHSSWVSERVSGTHLTSPEEIASSHIPMLPSPQSQQRSLIAEQSKKVTDPSPPDCGSNTREVERVTRDLAEAQGDFEQLVRTSVEPLVHGETIAQEKLANGWFHVVERSANGGTIEKNFDADRKLRSWELVNNDGSKEARFYNENERISGLNQSSFDGKSLWLSYRSDGSLQARSYRKRDGEDSFSETYGEKGRLEKRFREKNDGSRILLFDSGSRKTAP